MYLLIAHATLASYDCLFAHARCHARAAAAASHADYTQGWIFIFLSFHSLEARRLASNEGATKCRDSLSSGGWVRSKPDWVLEQMNWGFFLMSIVMGGARLGRKPTIRPALHLRYWPIQIETFFIFLHCMLVR